MFTLSFPDGSTIADSVPLTKLSAVGPEVVALTTIKIDTTSRIPAFVGHLLLVYGMKA